MTILRTESWGAFPRYNGDEANNATGNAARAAHAANVRAYGYDFSAPTANNIGWLVKADAVSPERWAYTFSSSGKTGEAAGFRMKMPTVPSVLIFGFSLFVPSSYTPNTTQSPEYPMMQVLSFAASSAYTAIPGRAEAAGELFRIDWGLRVRRGIAAVENAKAMVPGKLSYIECRISASEVRVWMDGTLVHQSTRAVSRESIAIMCTAWNGFTVGGTMEGAPAMWQVSNMYFLSEDAVEPNVRLGPATRVIANRPSADVDVDFSRPSGTLSNASVVGADFQTTNTASLTVRNIGDSDVYSASARDAVTGAGRVYAVSVKMLASNLETDPHAFKPLIVSGAAEAAAPNVSLPGLSGNTLVAGIATVDPITGVEWTTSAAADVDFGARLVS
jgi:hypothetical protein